MNACMHACMHAYMNEYMTMKIEMTNLQILATKQNSNQPRLNIDNNVSSLAGTRIFIKNMYGTVFRSVGFF